jgi:hypothetical protein
MTLNSSGPISLAGTTTGVSIEIENGGNGTTMISLNDTAVRTLAGVPSGAITMPTNFYGKSNTFTGSYTFTTNTANAALNITSISGYIAGKSNITVTVNSGIYLYATTNTSTYGLNLSGGTTGDTVTLVNNGYIMGLGGAGGTSNPSTPGNAGSTGGPALNVGIGVNITVNNTNASAYIGGGGGGGGGGSNGGGGGAGGAIGGYGRGGNTNYGAGGGVGAKGSNAVACCCGGGGGGGGRIFPGCGGAGASATDAGYGGGAGGGGGGGGQGGAGGAGNAAGSTATGNAGGGGGGWGASGGTSTGNGSGGAGGKAVNLNGKTITWTSGNTTRVYGTVS